MRIYPAALLTFLLLQEKINAFSFLRTLGKSDHATVVSPLRSSYLDSLTRKPDVGDKKKKSSSSDAPPPSPPSSGLSYLDDLSPAGSNSKQASSPASTTPPSSPPPSGSSYLDALTPETSTTTKTPQKKSPIIIPPSSASSSTNTDKETRVASSKSPPPSPPPSGSLEALSPQTSAAKKTSPQKSSPIIIPASSSASSTSTDKETPLASSKAPPPSPPPSGSSYLDALSPETSATTKTSPQKASPIIIPPSPPSSSTSKGKETPLASSKATPPSPPPSGLSYLDALSPKTSTTKKTSLQKSSSSSPSPSTSTDKETPSASSKAAPPSPPPSGPSYLDALSPKTSTTTKTSLQKSPSASTDKETPSESSKAPPPSPSPAVSSKDETMPSKDAPSPSQSPEKGSLLGAFSSTGWDEKSKSESPSRPLPFIPSFLNMFSIKQKEESKPSDAPPPSSSPTGSSYLDALSPASSPAKGEKTAKIQQSSPQPSPEAAAAGLSSLDMISSTDSTDKQKPPESTVPSPTRSYINGKSLTQRIMEKTSKSGQTGGAGGSSTWEAFLAAEKRWTELKNSSPIKYDEKILSKENIDSGPPTFITTDGAQGYAGCWDKLRYSLLDYDVVVCGGTLGIMLGTALQSRGYDVCVVEAGPLRGREQEWNISMKELLELVAMGVLTPDEVDKVITTEFAGCRSGFKNREVSPLKGSYFFNKIGYECFTPKVLNLGVSPSILLDIVSERFEKLGGVLLENSPLQGVVISESEGAALHIKTPDKKSDVVTARLVLDCMGNGSPITRQHRWGTKPDGVCAVVGTCAGGYDKTTNLVGDIIYTNTEIQRRGIEGGGQFQYFWEAFPVGIGRNGKEPGTSDVKTTYMFTYFDAENYRPSLLTLMEDYWELLPKYQTSISDVETDLDVKRVLFAYFPTYRESPLKPQFSRLLAVGDASGIQSPLSFGGFGALARHLERLTDAISEALDDDILHKDDLALINDYLPNLSVAWMFQKAMSVGKYQNPDPKFINRLLATNFNVMNGMGYNTIQPFLQDVVRADGLLGSLSRSFIADPFFMPQIVNHVGVPTLVDWTGHVWMMSVYGGLHNAYTPVLESVVKKMKNPREKFQLRRKMENWKYGSGSDYSFDYD